MQPPAFEGPPRTKFGMSREYSTKRIRIIPPNIVIHLKATSEARLNPFIRTYQTPHRRVCYGNLSPPLARREVVAAAHVDGADSAGETCRLAGFAFLEQRG